MLAIEFIILFSAASFLFYGTSCLLASHMRREFQRYQLSRYRQLTGILEITGALGLVAGLFNPVIGLAASAGLSLLMLLGFLVRRRIGDPILKSFPALLYLALSLYLSAAFTIRLSQS